MKNIAVFASGSGTNYQAIAEAIHNKILNANIALVVVDNPLAFVIERVKDYNHDIFVFNPKEYKGKKEYEDVILNKLKEKEVELVVLAGYMRILSKNFLDTFGGKVVNIHPALLPSFKGAHAIYDAYTFGVKVFGVTIHYIDETIDGGIILEQESFHIEKGQTLEEIEKRVHEIEHDIYPKTIQKIIEGEL